MGSTNSFAYLMTLEHVEAEEEVHILPNHDTNQRTNPQEKQARPTNLVLENGEAAVIIGISNL